jgi:hypothetical protein
LVIGIGTTTKRAELLTVNFDCDKSMPCSLCHAAWERQHCAGATTFT